MSHITIKQVMNDIIARKGTSALDLLVMAKMLKYNIVKSNSKKIIFGSNNSFDYLKPIELKNSIGYLTSEIDVWNLTDDEIKFLKR